MRISMIECKDLGVQFDGKQIINDLSFRVEKGEHVCISGVSGKGKSTLLKLLQGYVIPYSGSVEINGYTLNAANITSIRNLMTWIPQNVNLPVQNGFELVTLMEVEEQRPMILDFSEQLGLEPEMLDRDFNKISIGQKQRVLIAICFALNKEIILMDEPTASLDKDSISNLIRTTRRLDKTILSASHHPQWLHSTDKIIEL